jgi:hypothetical protein
LRWRKGRLMDVRQALINFRLLANAADSDDLELVREQIDMIRQIAVMALTKDAPKPPVSSGRRPGRPAP